MVDRKALGVLFAQHGYTDYRWLDPRDIVVAQWVRMKCTYGCDSYGRIACCPPHVPSVAACRQFFAEYTVGIVLHFQHALANPGDRHDWSRQVNADLVALERAVFLAGYHKAFLLYMDSCHLCKKCAGTRSECKRPDVARPSPEAMAVDVFSTARQCGYPIEVLTDYAQPMNRYAFLLIE